MRANDANPVAVSNSRSTDTADPRWVKSMVLIDTETVSIGPPSSSPLSDPPALIPKASDREPPDKLSIFVNALVFSWPALTPDNSH